MSHCPLLFGVNHQGFAHRQITFETSSHRCHCLSWGPSLRTAVELCSSSPPPSLASPLVIGYFRPFEVVVVASKIQSALEGHCNRCSLEIACSLASGFQHSAALAQLAVLLAHFWLSCPLRLKKNCHLL
uniref:Uncharacterized protein n=1 Tax=Opuntia streptacantha TaxID=393608 RepID=A0A7C9AKU2_OPUST